MGRFDQSGPGLDEEPLSWIEPDGINDFDKQIEELTRMFMEREMPPDHNKTMLAFVAEQIADNILEPCCQWSAGYWPSRPHEKCP